MPPFVRPFLAVSQTTLTNVNGKRHPFHGLFTTLDIPKGGFIGFYNGEYHQTEKPYNGRDAYVFTTSDGYIKPSRKKKAVDPAAYPIAMMNEPRPSESANVCAVELSSAKNVIPHRKPSTKIGAVGVYACRKIKAGEEIFINYGRHYKRNHYDNPDGIDPYKLVGPPCKILKEDREPVQQMQRAFGIEFVTVDPECYVLYEK
jgi:hypothetical protein